jgi:hypothetical protein
MLAEKFIADTGANRTVYPNGRNAYEYCSMPVEIKTASGTCMKSEGVGKLRLYNPDLQVVGGFENVLFCKGVTEKLASVGEMCDAGMVCVFDKDKLTTYRKEDVKIQGKVFTSDYRDEKSKLYPLTLLRKKGETQSSTVLAVVAECKPAKEYGGRDLPEQICEYNNGLPQSLLAKVYVKQGMSEIERYHAKFGDIGMKYLKRCLPMLRVPTQYRCEICIDGKMHKFNHNAVGPGIRPVYAPGVCIHSDHSGPYTRSIGNARYSQLYLDRGSGYVWAARQTKKTGHYEDTPRIFLDAWALSGKKVQVFQSDGDGVFTSAETRKMLEEQHVRHEWSAPYDSDTNAFIERARRTVFEGVACALLRSGAPSSLWGEAEAHKVYTMNMLPTVEDPDKPGSYCSRKNLLQGNRCPADLEKFMAFGTQATCFVPVDARSGGKHPGQRKSFHGAILGYEENMPAYRVWNFETRSIKVVSYNFTICHEGYFPFKDKKNWPADCVRDPEFFSPNCGGVPSREEWEKYDFDEESMEAKNENALFSQPQLQDSQESPAHQATGCVTPAVESRITGPARYQIGTQCLTDSPKNRLQDAIHAVPHSGVDGVVYSQPNARSTRAEQWEDGKNGYAGSESHARQPLTAKISSPAPFPVVESKEALPPTQESGPGNQPRRTQQFWKEMLSQYSVGNFLQSAVETGALCVSDPYAKPIGIPPPKNLREARLCPWWKEYKAAAQVEYDGHVKSGTWELVKKSSVPAGRNILRGKWVFDDKRNEEGKLSSSKLALLQWDLHRSTAWITKKPSPVL